MLRGNTAVGDFQGYGPTAIVVWYGPEYVEDAKLGFCTIGSIPRRTDSPLLIEALADRGADLRSRDFGGVSVLCNAVLQHNVESLAVLLANHVEPGVAANNGMNPLVGSDVACAKLLLKYGAKVLSRDSTGRTALDYPQCQADTKLRLLLINAARRESRSVRIKNGVVSARQ